MAHNLNIAAGRASMMYAGEVPWHGLGTRLDGPATAAEALEAARLDWEVGLEPIQTVSGLAIPDRVASVRRDTNTPLGVVGANYKVVQNREAFGFLDALAAEGRALYHAAGAIGLGERVWMLAELPGAIRVGRTNDLVEKYVLLSNSHDGTMAMRAFWTPIRVVCQNMLRAAIQLQDGKESKGEMQGVVIRHSGEIASKVNEGRRILGLAERYFDALPQHLDALVAHQMTTVSLKSYFAAIYPDPTDPGRAQAKKNAMAVRETLEGLFVVGIGHDQPGVAGSLWAAFNAVTEYVDHHKTGRGDESVRLNSIWWGDGATVKARAWDSAMAIVN